LRSGRCAEAICKHLLLRGKYHQERIREMGFVVTPFFDVVKRALQVMPDNARPILTQYLETARAKKAWQAKRILEFALKNQKRIND
ncbi:MAG: hypothetical protein AAGE94_12475, partial [Acidobacteriota bacterium]